MRQRKRYILGLIMYFVVFHVLLQSVEQQLQSRITELEEQLQSIEGGKRAVVEQVIMAEKAVATHQGTVKQLKQGVGYIKDIISSLIFGVKPPFSFSI